MKKKHKIPFFNRELSWIEFNARVLKEACRKDIPVMEKLQFLAIVSSNFNDFFQIRVAAIKRLLKEAPDIKDSSGLNPRELLKKISLRCHEIVHVQHDCLVNDVLPSLKQNGIEYVPPSDFTTYQKAFTKHLFNTQIFPLLTPLRIDTENFPSIRNLQLHAAFLLKRMEGIPPLENMPQQETSEPFISIVQIPSVIQRVIPFGGNDKKKSFCLLDDLVLQYGTQLFPGFTVEQTMLFKITRDADLSVNSADNDFIDAVEEAIAQRQSSFAVRLLCTQSSRDILKVLSEKLEIEEDDIYQVGGIMDPSTLLDITKMENTEKLHYPVWHHFYSADLPAQGAYWDTIKQKDILLHFPYQSYNPVIKFISDAADDPDVLAIKMTLYRAGHESPIIDALKRAADNGKQVTCFVELMARFDEERNIAWAEQLEKANVTVIYGIVNYKVHSKILMVMRRENSAIVRYVYLSTGNFNPKTARQYSDLGILTANPEIANDATQFFNIVSGYSAIQTMNHMSMAPINLKTNILAMIQREIERSTPENPGLIIAKMNSLSHEEVIKALYKASQAGVKILLNVRGICMLVPGVNKISENITVVSIVDRYLEHSRIFYFRNSGAEEIYLSSADWMPRNLDRRIELMFPVTDRTLFKNIFEILNLYFTDNTHSHTLLSSGKWVETKNGTILKHAQKELYLKYKKTADTNTKIPEIEFRARRKN
ncbi:polyphosphate kinase 1 [Treponema parvum]|uniref:polyphosphate kinase 1 n=1 Tax=Treponema parvum TaxID=138851 RepID=UPI001AEBEAE0|nr:polyphosphate kinase 1 [Treponema parvum]QTQ15454.1 polyphosphate kinase 1 [Treponema parvum]